MPSQGDCPIARKPSDPARFDFVCEAWPSVQTRAELTEALIDDVPVQITSRMEAGGVAFGDSIEADHLDLSWGTRATLGVASDRLKLVITRD